MSVCSDSDSSGSAGADPDRLPFQVRDYATASRKALDRLRETQLSGAEQFHDLSNIVAMLDGLGAQVHPRLGEKLRRLVAQVQRLGRLGPAAVSDPRYEEVLARLAELEENPLWALPMPRSSESASSPGAGFSANASAVVRPGEIFPDRVVFYSLGSLRFCVRGELRYNIRGADLNRSYAARAGQPPVQIFPHPEQDSRAFPASPGGNHLMVFALAEERVLAFDRERLLALRYERILDIENHRPAEYEQAMVPLKRRHPVVQGCIKRRGRRYYVVA